MLSSGYTKNRATSGTEYIRASVSPTWASPLTKSWDGGEKLNKRWLLVILPTQKQEAQGAGVLLIVYCSKKLED